MSLTKGCRKKIAERIAYRLVEMGFSAVAIADRETEIDGMISEFMMYDS